MIMVRVTPRPQHHYGVHRDQRQRRHHHCHQSEQHDAAGRAGEHADERRDQRGQDQAEECEGPDVRGSEKVHVRDAVEMWRRTSISRGTMQSPHGLPGYRR
jgi:hypothetical protein